jgi:hypothetical protein
MAFGNCYHCGKEIGFTNYGVCVVRRAIKPPKSPNRWKALGHMCHDCDDAKKISSFDKWKGDY